MTAHPRGTEQLKETHIATVPSGSKKPLPFSLRRRGNRWHVQIFWGWFLAWILVVSLIVWIGASSAAYLWVKHKRGFTDVKFTDMLLLPARWDDYQKARGDFLISTAKKDLEEQRFREAFQGLRAGLAKAPDNKEGRLLLAQFYGAWKRPDLTRQTLLDGIAYHSEDLEYMRALFGFLLNLQEDKKVISLSRELLTKNAADTERDRLVAFAAATASYFRGNYDQAENLLRTYSLEDSHEGRSLAARIAWERGSKDRAIDMLRELAAEVPNDEDVYAQTVAYLRESGREEEARRESFLRALADPKNARARIDQLYAQHQLGDTAAVKAGVEDILVDFSTDADSLASLGDFAANIGDVQLAQRIYEHTKSKKMASESAALMTVEAHVVARRYQEALALVRQLQKEHPDWNKRFANIFNGLQAIAHYGVGDAEAAQLFLNNYLSQPDLRAENLVAVSKRLLDVGAKAQARQVLDHAVQADPLNQAALSNLIKLDLALNNTTALAKNVRTLLTMRRPSLDILRGAYRKLGSDIFLFSPDRTALLQSLSDAISGKPAPSVES